MNSYDPKNDYCPFFISFIDEDGLSNPISLDSAFCNGVESIIIGNTKSYDNEYDVMVRIKVKLGICGVFILGDTETNYVNENVIADIDIDNNTI